MFVGVGVAQATYFSGGFAALGRLDIKPYNYNSTYQTAMDRAINNWNATPTRADIVKSSGSPNVAVAQSRAET